jgi:hypothetical protein
MLHAYSARTVLSILSPGIVTNNMIYLVYPQKCSRNRLTKPHGAPHHSDRDSQAGIRACYRWKSATRDEFLYMVYTVIICTAALHLRYGMWTVSRASRTSSSNPFSILEIQTPALIKEWARAEPPA